MRKLAHAFWVLLMVGAFLTAPACGSDSSEPKHPSDAGGDAPVFDVASDVFPGNDAAPDGAGDADASCSPEDCSGHCNDQKQNCGEGSTDCGAGCAPCPTGSIVDDELPESGCSNGCKRSVEGGTWTAQGWSPHGFEDRVVYDLGRGVACGRMVVEVQGFDPYQQFSPQGVSAMYVELMALYEGPSEDHHSAAGSQVNVIYAPCFDCTDPNDHYRTKVTSALVTNCDWADSPYTGPIFDPALGNGSFVFDLRWSPEGISLKVTGDVSGAEQTQITYPSYPDGCHCSKKTPALRFAYLGRARVAAGGHLDGPVFSRAAIWADDCDTKDW